MGGCARMGGCSAGAGGWIAGGGWVWGLNRGDGVRAMAESFAVTGFWGLGLCAGIVLETL